MEATIKQVAASYRDPAGYMYELHGQLYRYVSKSYQQHYETAKVSGLYEELVKKEHLLPFEEIYENHTHNTDWLITLQPPRITPETLPAEWSFEQLKDAALTTLTICMAALEKGFILKDATPQNIRFYKGRPVLIDHLSFEIYHDGAPWEAYRQFCEMQFYPLLLAHYRGIEVSRTLTAWPDGIPATTVNSLLPLQARLRVSTLLHVVTPARLSKKNRAAAVKEHPKSKLSKAGLLHILNNLHNTIQSLTPASQKSGWSTYYEETILSNAYLSEKKKIVGAFVQQLQKETILDAGCNDGVFTLLIPPTNNIIAADADETCINNLYVHCRTQKITHVFPIVLNLMQPTPASGWAHQEHKAFWERCEFDTIMALALIHHLSISNNVPFEKIAATFSRKAKQLLIEFVPKDDPKVMELLAHRTDIFSWYNQQHFEAVFSGYYTWDKPVAIPHSNRLLYFMKRKSF